MDYGLINDGSSPPDLQSYFAGEQADCAIALEVEGLDEGIRLDSRTQPFVLVGRSRDCDLCLPHADVSHRHTSLQLIGGRVFCVDLMSRNGTHWSDGGRKRSGWLLPGQSLQIGPYRISHPGTEEETATNLAVPFEPAGENLLRKTEPLDYELAFLNGSGHSENTWSMNAPMVLVGKSKRCRLSINHPSVSRVHCSLTATPAGVWVTDLLGRDGTWVNDERISKRLLRPGDVVRVGKFRFRVNHNGQRTNIEPDPAPAVTPNWGDFAPGGTPAPATSGLSENAVLTMMERFSQMQQQMFEMSHQQMMMMTQLVGNMHSNYSDLAQQELARINEIGTQIDQLQAKIAEGKEADAVPDVQNEPIQRRLEEPQPQPAPVDPPAHENPAATGLEPEESVAGENEPEAEEARRRPYSQGDIESHAMLVERMSTLERERTSRWKKLMSLLSGSPR